MEVGVVTDSTPDTAALLVVTLYRCGECGTIASREAWNDAWWRYRSAHMVTDPDEWPAHSRGPHDEDMVCPACSYLHRDNDEGDVREVKGHATPDLDALLEVLADV
jgi:hypothetical protein